MKQITENYLNAVQDYGREWQNEVVITNGVDTETYTSIQVNITVPFSQDTLSMGQSFTKELTLKIYEPQRTLLYNVSTIKVYAKLKVGNEFVSMQMGEFFPSEVSTNDDYQTLDIKAFDKMAKLNDTYEPNVSAPYTDTSILNDICTQYGITLATGTTGLGETIELIEGTVAEQLGYIAGLQGKNSVFDDSGNLVFKWYTKASSSGRWRDFPIAWQDINGTWANSFSATYSVERKDQKEGGVTLNEGEFLIASITSGTEETPITVGTGKGITFVNPYMTQTLLTTIGNRELNKSTTVGTVKSFGNPALEVGDIVAVIDKQNTAHDFFISKIEWNFTGGCSAIYTAIGNPDAEIEFSSESPTDKKISKVKTVVQEVANSFSNLINSLVGYYTITEENGIPTGWTIKDNLTTPQNMIKCSLGGIGISSDGGQTYQTAITGEGIVADTITSGTINAIDITGSQITGGRIDGSTIYGGSLTSVARDTQDNVIATVQIANGQLAMKGENDQSAARLSATALNNTTGELDLYENGSLIIHAGLHHNASTSEPLIEINGGTEGNGHLRTKDTNGYVTFDTELKDEQGVYTDFYMTRSGKTVTLFIQGSTHITSETITAGFRPYHQVYAPIICKASADSKYHSGWLVIKANGVISGTYINSSGGTTSIGTGDEIYGTVTYVAQARLVDITDI